MGGFRGAGAVGDGGAVMCETKRCGNGEEWQGEFWNHYSRCDNGITGHANILEPFVSAIASKSKMNEIMKEGYCRERVYDRNSVFGHFYQCSRKAWKDGYCKQHHPDTVAGRRKASELRYEEQKKKSPWYRLKQAQERIKELEAEVGRLKAGF